MFKKIKYKILIVNALQMESIGRKGAEQYLVELSTHSFCLPSWE